MMMLFFSGSISLFLVLFSTTFVTAVPVLTASAAGQVPLSGPVQAAGSDSESQSLYEIPTRYESTVLGRRMLELASTGVLSTVFPPPVNRSDHTSVGVPDAVASTPIGLPDYIASCENAGNPTLLALDLSTSSRNVAAGSNVSLTLSWWDEYVKRTRREPWSAANLPRASLIGYLEEIPLEDAERQGLVECFTAKHRDAKLWLPGDRGAAHAGRWMRMVVQEVYWVGGFGDRAYIGWLDIGEWRSVGRKEWTDVRLPGEN